MEITQIIDGVHTRRVQDPTAEEVCEVPCEECGAPKGYYCSLPPASLDRVHASRCDAFEAVERAAFAEHDLKYRRDAIVALRATGVLVSCSGSPCGVCYVCLPSKGSP